MDYEIINCYELDVRQDIPTEFVQLRHDNETVRQTNKFLKVVLLGIVFGIAISAVIQIRQANKHKDD